MYRRINGFTLIELAIVLLILGISATIVFPKLAGSLVQQAQLRSSTNRIAAVAEYAHHQAACARQTYVLCLHPEERSYWASPQPSDEHVVPAIETSSWKGLLPEQMEVARICLRGEDADLKGIIAIRFSPQGWADPATIDIRAFTGEMMRIDIGEFSAQVETYEMKGTH